MGPKCFALSGEKFAKENRFARKIKVKLLFKLTCDWREGILILSVAFSLTRILRERLTVKTIS